MFNFFRKKVETKLDSVEVAFIEAIVNKLSTKYPLFRQQLELKTFVGIGKNPGGSVGSFTYFIDNDSWKKICNPALGNFDIKNIVFRSFAGDKANVDLYISEGLIVGYWTSVEVKEIDVTTIDIYHIWEKHFLNDDYSEVEHIFGPLSKEQLKKLGMAKNTFKISIDGSNYYPVHDVGDGNYIAVDRNGSVFEIRHDPLEVKKIYDSIFKFLEKM